MSFDLVSAYERTHGVAVPGLVVAPARGVTPLSAHQVDWEFEPTTFKVFCESKEHMGMLPRDWKPTDIEGALSKKQYDDCMSILGDDPLTMFDPDKRRYTFGALLWAKGCVAGSTKIYDEITKKNYAIKDIVDKKLKISIKAYNHKTKAVVIKPVARVFSKGMSELYTVYFKSGRTITVSPEHRFSCGKEYIKAKFFIPAPTAFEVNGLNKNELIPDRVTKIIKEQAGEIFDLTVDEETPNYFTADGLLHHNSGKDLICSLIHAYVVYVLLCLRSPQDFFGFAPGEPCDILNVGKKGAQAERVYFTKFRARLLKWEWMLRRFNVTDEGKRFRYNGKNFSYCKIGTRSAEWGSKNIRAFAENSGDAGSLEGYNIVYFICDEISSWISELERKQADKILTTLRTSQSSRNTKRLCGLGLAISYPRQDEDIMFDIEKESQAPDSKVFFSRGYQWQVKPKRFYSGKTFPFNAGTEERPEWFDIPTELDVDFFRKYPEQAKCFYLLRPPAVGGPFFEFTDKIDAISYKDRAPLFKVETSCIDSLDGKGNKIIYIRKKIVGLNRAPQQNIDYVAWMDAAESMCDASLSVGHIEAVTLVEGSDRREVLAVVIDQTIVWEPDPETRKIVDIGSMTTCCIDMLKYITLKVAWWDQWNSGTGMKDLRDRQIMCDKHNLTGNDYEFFKGMIYTNRVIAPNCPETDKGIGQVKHLSRTRTNNVTPGSAKHKKDISDTWCGVTLLLLGNLAPNSSLRAGRAPGAITLGGTGAGAGIPGQGVQNTNPFSQSTRSASRNINDHSDLFKSLSPLSQQGLNRDLMGRTRTQAPKPPSANPSRFPRGITL